MQEKVEGPPSLTSILLMKASRVDRSARAWQARLPRRPDSRACTALLITSAPCTAFTDSCLHPAGLAELFQATNSSHTSETRRFLGNSSAVLPAACSRCTLPQWQSTVQTEEAAAEGVDSFALLGLVLCPTCICKGLKCMPLHGCVACLVHIQHQQDLQRVSDDRALSHHGERSQCEHSCSCQKPQSCCAVQVPELAGQTGCWCRQARVQRTEHTWAASAFAEPQSWRRFCARSLERRMPLY